MPGDTFSFPLSGYISEVGTNQFSLTAVTNPDTVGSVVFSLTGPVSENRTENTPPYALFGESNGDFAGRELLVGSYTLTATPFSQANGQGEAGLSKTIVFEVLEDTTTTQFTLTTNAGAGGSIDPVGSNSFDEGTQVTITAIPDNGFRFVNFTDGDDYIISTSNPFVLTITQDKSVTAKL